MASTLADFTLSASAAADDFIVGYDEAALNGERRWTVSTIAKAVSGAASLGTVKNVTGTAPISVANGTTTPAISIAAATTVAAGSMSSTDKTRLDDASGVNGIVKCDGAGNFSVAVAGTDYPSGIQGTKAWVNFNGTTSPGTIRSSYNVSSVTKNADGDYTVNFNTAMADANYSILLTGDYQGTTPTNGGTLTYLSRNSRPSVSSFRFESWSGSGGLNASLQLNVAVFGN